MKKILLLSSLLLLAGCRRHRGHSSKSSASHGALAPACPPSTTPAGPAVSIASLDNVTLNSDDEKTLYALGTMMGERVKELRLSGKEITIIQRALLDKLNDAKPMVEIETYGPRLETLAQARIAAGSEQNKRDGAEFAKRAALEPNARVLPSGVVYIETQPGTGDQPTPQDEVEVQYRGTLINGTEFDSSAKHGGTPAKFLLGGVVPCWTQGVALMRAGGKAKLVCPSDTAYGDRPQRVIPAGSTLVFEVELVKVTRTATVAPMPSLNSPTINIAPPPTGGPSSNPAAPPH